MFSVTPFLVGTGSRASPGFQKCLMPTVEYPGLMEKYPPPQYATSSYNCYLCSANISLYLEAGIQTSPIEAAEMLPPSSSQNGDRWTL